MAGGATAGGGAAGVAGAAKRGGVGARSVARQPGGGVGVDFGRATGFWRGRCGRGSDFEAFARRADHAVGRDRDLGFPVVGRRWECSRRYRRRLRDRGRAERGGHRNRQHSDHVMLDALIRTTSGMTRRPLRRLRRRSRTAGIVEDEGANCDEIGACLPKAARSRPATRRNRRREFRRPQPTIRHARRWPRSEGLGRARQARRT